MSQPKPIVVPILLAVLTAGLALPTVSRENYPPAIQDELATVPDAIDFNFHVKPILSDRCYVCHGPDENKRYMQLRLDTAEGAYDQLLMSDGAAVVPHHPEESFLVERILSEDADHGMPPPESNLSLSNREKAILIAWIQQGAEYKRHWSFIPLQESMAQHSTPEGFANPVDFFVDAKHREQGLRFSPMADKATLLRRVSFDLTGMPPSPETVRAFLKDTRDDAYERAVDRLLASPQYGERMAVDWLDLSRYSDTYGYQADNERPMHWWRDWVIDAYNQNMPFDQFITEQLAGDLFDAPTRDQILATAFNRNHPQNAEGGIINEEFRVEYVADRTNTFGKALLGVTMECARCHDHKYDPISQVDYYALSAFFNQVDEAGQITWTRNDIPSPALMLPDAETEQQLKRIDDEIDSALQDIEQITKRERTDFRRWLHEVHENPALIDQPSRTLIAHYPLDVFDNQRIANRITDATGRVVDPVSMALEPNPLPTTMRDDSPAVSLNGDSMLDFPGVGRFRKGDAFSVGMWIHVPTDLKNGAIFHSNRGGIIYSFKGYQLSIEDGHFDIRLAHTFPERSIHIRAGSVPREQWLHVMLTYDGGGQAENVRFYVNAQQQAGTVLRNNLPKDIVFIRDGIGTNLRVGARWRSKGFSGGAVDDIRVYNEALSPLGVDQSMGGSRLARLISSPPQSLSAGSITALYEYYLHEASTRYSHARERLRTLRIQRDDIREYIDEIMVMRDMETPRPTWVLNRGLYSERGAEVQPHTPPAILSFDEDFPRNRLGLAQWLVDEENPLTARVLANRLWQRFFGRGLVSTLEDFGSQGALPTHPELLDWLAMEILQRNWDLKSIQKTIVMSKTYQQRSTASPDALETDPENLWMARGPSQRLPAEMLRDQALAASGLLNPTLGGPSVKPYQPEGLWSFGTNTNYVMSSGDDLYRRSVYTFWKRTVPPPSMNLFDAPERSVCTMQRQKTSTPMQALVLMNDPQFIEASRALAVTLLSDETLQDSQRIAEAYKALTSRSPRQEELGLLVDLHREMLKTFETHPERMDGILTLGEFQHPDRLPPAAVAATTIVVNTIMNSDASVMKR